jgi:perosamine synthetase
MGSYIDRFEEEFAAYIGVQYATTVTNGTAALHLALASCNIGPGDEIIIPDQTIISCAFAALYVGATPVLADVDPQTGNIALDKIESYITPKTKAIMVVHLFGNPVAMDIVVAIAKKHNLLVIEDTAQAHGAVYKGVKAGAWGDIATFSFYANKTLTTGEGGMVVTNNKDFYEKAHTMKNLSHKPGKRFYHEMVGYNYRMTNLQAALGLAHLREIDTYLEKKEWMAKLYEQHLKKNAFLELPQPNKEGRNTYWMYNVLLKENSPLSRDTLLERLKTKGVDTRTYFYPLHSQPVLQHKAKYTLSDLQTSIQIAEKGFYLPSGLAITEQQIFAVCKAVEECLQ